MSVSFSPLSSALTLPSEQLAAIHSRYMTASLDVMSQFKNGTLAAPSDRRFHDQAWVTNPVHMANAHMYLLTVQALNEMVDAAQADEPLLKRLRFSVMQWAEAVSPANFFLTNPEAQKKALETGGQSLVNGLQLLFDDLQKGRLTQTDESAFEVGVNLAITPGSVIYENPLMQLIQYSPQTETVYEKPLLIVPPCINKYYILDLQEHNSFVNHAVQQGFTVFLISWRNPMPDDTDNIQRATWGDFLQHGILQAARVSRQISGQDQISALGFCVGGTMLASALALANAQGDQPVSSMTLLTSFLDFQDTGVISVMVDELHAQIRDQQLGVGGLMTARELATTFSFLRPSELVWNYVVNGYLMGDAPRAFDLLYWNADGTNLSGSFFAWYFRNAYLENNLIQPGKVRIDGYPLDLGSLNMPVYIYGSQDDHIVPWKGAYATTRVVANPQRFVLGASGHIAGVINPPARGRRSYWTHDEDATACARLSADDWRAAATEHPGSWWPDWTHWLAGQSGSKIKASATVGNKQFVPIEAAPGRYVRVRAL